MSMVGDVRIASGIEFQMKGAAKRKNETEVSAGWTGDKKVVVRGAKRTIDDNECAKRDIEESLYRGLYM